MIRIPPINDFCKSEYLKDTFPALKQFLNSVKNNPDYEKEIGYLSNGEELDDEKISNLLIGDISKLEHTITEIGTIQPRRENDGFHRLYENFTKRKLGKTWAEKIGVSICPYCNRSYIFTLKKSGVRPQYDHFFPKSLYPYLALSMYNLIPCCAICNQAKSDFNTFNTETHSANFIYPHTDSYGDRIKFDISIEDDIFALLGSSNNFEIDILGLDGDAGQNAQKAVETLSLRELYNKHIDYVQDIIKTTYIYDDNYFQSLSETFPDFFKSPEEAANLVYMNFLNEEDWDKRILSKLTHDIKLKFQK